MTINHDLPISITQASKISDKLQQAPLGKFDVRFKEVAGGVHMEIQPVNRVEGTARGYVRDVIKSVLGTEDVPEMDGATYIP